MKVVILKYLSLIVPGLRGVLKVSLSLRSFKLRGVFVMNIALPVKTRKPSWLDRDGFLWFFNFDLFYSG